MPSAQWTPATDASSATWSENKTLSDLQAAGTTYDSSSTTYDSSTTYYDGYNPNLTTPEGESGALWLAVSE